MSRDTGYYEYVPSLAASVISLVAFGACFVYHTYKLFRTRRWFCLPFSIGALFESIGYGIRAYGHTTPEHKTAFILQSLFILLAPILFAASVYMFLNRMIRDADLQEFSIISTKWLTKVFVGGDILCFIIQGAGGAILTSSDSEKASNVGKAIILLGLILQIAIFGFFIFVQVVLQSRAREARNRKTDMATSGWEWYLYHLYAVSVLISVRNIFRVVEYAMGKNGYLMATEWPMYVFDALLMALVLTVCSLWYDRQSVNIVTGEQDIDLLAMDGRSAIEPRDQA